MLTGLIEEFLDDLVVNGRSLATVRTYRQSLGHFTEFVGDVDPRSISRATIKAFFVDRRQRGEAQTTLANRHIALGSFWTWLISEGEADNNPVRSVRRPKETVKPVPLVSDQQVSELLKLEARTRFLTMRNRAIILLLVDTGIRVGELCGMKTGDVDFTHRLITVDGKTGQRPVPIGKTCTQALRRFLRHRAKHPKAGSQYLFIGAHSGIEPISVLKMIRTYGERVGIENLYPHRLRHSWTSNMLLAGASITDVQSLGGWSSPKQIMTRYGLAGQQARAFEAHRRYSPGDRLG